MESDALSTELSNSPARSQSFQSQVKKEENSEDQAKPSNAKTANSDYAKVKPMGLAGSPCLEVLYEGAGGAAPRTLSVALLSQLQKDLRIGCGAMNNTHTTETEAFLFAFPATAAIATEMGTCLHPQVFLDHPLSAKQLFSLSLRLLRRYEAFLAHTLDIPTPSFPQGAAAFAGVSDSLGGELSISTGPNMGPTSPDRAPATPQQGTAADGLNTKTPGSVGMNMPPQTPGLTGPGPNMSPYSASLEETAWAARDLLMLQQWVMGPFLSQASTVLGGALGLAEAIGTDKDTSSKVDALLCTQGAKLCQVRLSAMRKLKSDVGAECRRAILGDMRGQTSGGNAVRAIANKYRMTNKPPPEAPSPYVEGVLAPLKQYLKLHGNRLSALLVSNGSNTNGLKGLNGDTEKFDKAETAAPTDSTESIDPTDSRWAVEIIEDVVACMLLQVQSLNETVRKMDSTLNARRNKMGNRGSSGTYLRTLIYFI